MSDVLYDLFRVVHELIEPVGELADLVDAPYLNRFVRSPLPLAMSLSMRDMPPMDTVTPS